MSFDDNIKIVVMDEFDHFSKDGQAAFRGFIDEFGQNCRFIFTGNYKEKIIEPLLDRLEVHDFNTFSKEEMRKPIFHRLQFILTNEGIEFDPRDVVPVIATYYPRIRSMVGVLQKFSKDGKFTISEGDLDDMNIYDNLMNMINGDYVKMINEVLKLNSPDNMYSFLFKNMSKYFPPANYSSVNITIADYQFMSAQARDKHITLGACLAKLGKLL